MPDGCLPKTAQLLAPADHALASARCSDDIVRVCIADDHELIRGGLRGALTEIDWIEIVGEASSGRAALALVEAERPDVVLLDVRMPDLDGLTSVRLILQRHPQIKVIMLSASEDPADIQAAFDGGASAYLGKRVHPEDLVSGLRQVVQGTVYHAGAVLRQAERANVKLSHRHHRAPTDAEIATELGTDVDDVRDTLLTLSQSTVIALDGLWTVSDGTGDQVALVDTLRDDDAPDPIASIDAAELKDRLARAIALLPERERLVVGLYYYEGLTLAEIGRVLDVSESRCSQLNAAAMLRLRGWLTEEQGAELAIAA